MIREVRRLLDEKKFAQLRDLLCSVEAADVAQLFEQFPMEEIPLMFRILQKDFATDVFVEMDTELQKSLIEAFTDQELFEVFDDLFMDDTVDIIEEMPANVVKRILRHTTAEKRKEINQLLQYKADSAGTIMTTEFVDLKEDMTCGQALDFIRRTGLEKETVYTCYVMDSKRILLGVVTVKDIIMAGNEARIGNIMEKSPVFVYTDDDKEDVMNAITKYDFLAMPVTDREGRLVGIVTIDDAMDVLREEDTEDMEIMAAITPSDKPYFRVGVFETWKNRIPWLMLLMISATFTSKVLTHFENALNSLPILMAFVPQLMDTGGNAGSQASVTVIRGLSVGDIRLRDALRVLWKEVRVSLLCAVTLGIVNFMKMYLFNDVSRDRFGLGQSLLISLVVCVTIACTVVIAKIVGSMLPMLAKRLGLDPAVMASPFITTIVDILSLLIYFGIAAALLDSVGAVI